MVQPLDKNETSQLTLPELDSLTPEILSQLVIECLTRLDSVPALDALPKEVRAELAASGLRSLEIGRQPLGLFTQIGRHAVLSTVEVVPIRNRGSAELGIVMTQRSADDPWWPNQWHVPGTVLLPTDTLAGPHDFSGPLDRIFSGELGESVTPVGPTQVFDTQRRTGPRGHELTAHTWQEVVQKRRLPRDARIFSESDLREADPAIFVNGHGVNAEFAAKHYKKHLHS